MPTQKIIFSNMIWWLLQINHTSRLMCDHKIGVNMICYLFYIQLCCNNLAAELYAFYISHWSVHCLVLVCVFIVYWMWFFFWVAILLYCFDLCTNILLLSFLLRYYEFAKYMYVQKVYCYVYYTTPDFFAHTVYLTVTGAWPDLYSTLWVYDLIV